jgi:hypothetical protein
MQFGFSAIFRQETILTIYITNVPCIEKCIIACWSSATPSYLTSCTPTKSGLHFDISLATVTNEIALYKLLTFHMSDVYCSLLKSFIQRERPSPRPCIIFRNKIIFTLTVLRPMPNTQFGGLPLVVCQRRFIQYIRSHAPYMEVWINLAQDRDPRRTPVNTAMNFRAPKIVWKFLSS